MLNAVVLSVVMLNAVILSVIMLNSVVLSVIASVFYPITLQCQSGRTAFLANRWLGDEASSNLRAVY
jgi:hypothetical protein